LFPVRADAPARRIAGRLRTDWRDRYRAPFWNGVGGALPRLIVLLAGFYVARRYGAEGFARYSLAFVTVMLAGNLPGTTIATVGAKYVAELAHGRDRGHLSLLLVAAGLALFLGGVLVLLGQFVTRAIGGDDTVAGLMPIAAIVIVAIIVHGAATGMLLGETRFRALALVNFAGALAFAALLVPLNERFGLSGAVLSLAALPALAATATLVLLRRRLTHDQSSNWSTVRRQATAMLAFFLPTLIAAGMVTPVTWLVNSLLTRSPGALADVARFNAAYNWFAVISFVPAVLAQVEFVRLARAKGAGDVGQLAVRLRVFLVRNLVLMLAIVLPAIALAGPLASLFHVDDASGRVCVRLMLLAACAAGVGNPAGLFLGVIDRMWIASALNVGWASVVLVCAAVLAEHGAMGVSIAFLIGYCAHLAVAVPVGLRLTSRYASRGTREPT
jgi:O-antigen/teichoic acid export membrane protein